MCFHGKGIAPRGNPIMVICPIAPSVTDPITKMEVGHTLGAYTDRNFVAKYTQQVLHFDHFINKRHGT